jgi:alpha-tubulin suppressor-like RCC1 family protein
MKLKNFTYVGISNSPNSDITLKSLKDEEFEWASGRFYLFYPVQKQNIIGFGQNGSNQLGEANESFKTPQISIPEVKEGSGTFRPVRVYGRGQYSVAVTSQGMLYETGSMEGGGTSHGKFTKVN